MRNADIMFIVKTMRKGLMVEVTVIEKRWSESMLSNVVETISSSRFFLRSSARRWANKEMLKVIDQRYGMEYING